MGEPRVQLDGGAEGFGISVPRVRTSRRVRAPLAVAVLLAAIVASSSHTCGAQAISPPADPWQNMIAPDRPGAATPPSVLDRGVFQIETSFESQTARPIDASDVTTQDFPTLLRLGVGHSLEIRAESNTVSLEQAVTGFADMSVEAKWLALSRTEGRVPSVAFLPAVSFPTGTSDFSAGKVQGGISGLLGWTLHSGTSLSLDANIARVVEDSDSPYEWQLGSQGAFQIPLRRDWAVSGDVFVSEALVSGSSAPWGLDAGVEFYPNPDIQIDLVAVQTFTEPGTSTAVQIGFSWRIGLGAARH